MLKEFPYTLHCIVIHEGEDNSGHYYSYIKNHIEDKWFKYDDHRVSYVEEEQVLGEAFGLTKLKTSAYLVMYVAKSVIDKPHGFKTEFDYYLSFIPKSLLKKVNKDNYHFNELLMESKNKELANEIMEYYKVLDSSLKKKVAGLSDRSLISFPIFCYKHQSMIICQHVMLATAIQEKHPAKLSIECLDQTLEATLLKAFQREIIYLSDQHKKNLEMLKVGYLYNFEVSYLIHHVIDCLINEKYSAALETVSYINAQDPNTTFLQKLLKNKKDILYKHLQIFICYLLSKSNHDLVKGQTEEMLNKVSLVSLMALNYIPFSSSLYTNLANLLRHIYGLIESSLTPEDAKGYKRLIDGVEKQTVTKHHSIKPKISKDVRKKIDSLKNISLYQ